MRCTAKKTASKINDSLLRKYVERMRCGSWGKGRRGGLGTEGEMDDLGVLEAV